MPTIEYLSLDTKDWKQADYTDSVITSHNQYGDVFTINFFNKPPDIGADLSSIDPLRNFYRQVITKAGGAFVACEVVTIDEIPSVYAIFKFRRPEGRTGLDFLGSITIPFAHFSYVIKFQCHELGTTGVREAVVMTMLLRETKWDWNKERNPKWYHDPYDLSISEPFTYFVADDTKYDSLFPDHPLSRVRRFLQAAQETIRLDPSLKTEPLFSKIPQRQKKLWFWQKW